MSSLRLSFRIPKALPCRLSPPNHHHHHKFSISSCQPKHQKQACTSRILGVANRVEYCTSRIIGVALQVGGVLATAAAEPALALTGTTEGESLEWILIQSAISAFLYFIVAPPIIMNWLRIRWYKRNLLEMYFQFMFVFLFFPGVLVWAPFLNFRKFPRDPAMKYPWSVPENPSSIKGGFLKYPWAKPEDYEY